MLTVKLIKNTAPVFATRMQDVREGATMDELLFRRILLYKTTMAAVKKMLEQGLISAEEYAIIDTKIAEKYALSSSTIYR